MLDRWNKFHSVCEAPGPRGLNIPHVILTDRDPMAVGEPLVRRRLINILDVLEGDVDHDDMDTDEVIARAGVYGCFVNEITLSLSCLPVDWPKPCSRSLSGNYLWRKLP